MLSLACGPAKEVQWWLDQAGDLPHPVQINLLDQDGGALDAAHGALTRRLSAREDGSANVSIRGLHLSVRQLLRQKDADLAEFVSHTVRDLDLIYSAGLFDYLPDPVAQELVRVLYGALAPGGRLLIGNLRNTPDTTWWMDHVFAWHLIYREEDAMLDMASSLGDTPASVGLRLDETERCFFLEVVKPTDR